VTVANPFLQTNCLSETYFEAAERRATELDVAVRTNGYIVGTLHGLPIGLKDRFNVYGLDSTCCYVSWIGNAMKGDDEGVLVQHLKQAGAIIFVKTNVPTGMLIGETTNNIIWSMRNPYNGKLTAGGRG
jgi:amidase